MAREDIENNVGYWQEKANLEYIRQRQEHGVNDPYMITEIDEAFDAGYDKGYQYALQHPQWISVEEELPKMEIDDWRSDDLLFVTSDGIRRYGFCNNRGAWFSSVMGFAASQVTHWMPLPEAPRKEE